MFIDKVKIHNFKCYRDFEIIFDEGLNIVVGDNEAGKSTILEAINLALTGIIRGKSIWNEISQYIFNKDAVEEYIISLSTVPIALPYISIEIYFGGNENPLMNGDGNSDRNSSAEGFCFKIAFNEKYADEYEALLSQGNIKSLPIEYYDIIWTTFARDVITTRSIPYKSCLIDSSEYRYQSGSDVYLSRIIKGTLEIEDITSIAQAHRKMRDSFINDASIMDVDYTSGRKLNKELISRLATCEYISEHRNIFITGATGCGKTYMACAFGMEACKQYFNTKYVRLPDLLIDLELARDNGNYKKIMAKYANPVLLILDEWLLLKPTESEQRDIFELLHRRRKKSSTIFCSQYEFEEWYDQLGGSDSPLADAILDRIAYDSYRINIRGIDIEHDISMREVYGLDKSLRE